MRLREHSGGTIDTCYLWVSPADDQRLYVNWNRRTYCGNRRKFEEAIEVVKFTRFLDAKGESYAFPDIQFEDVDHDGRIDKRLEVLNSHTFLVWLDTNGDHDYGVEFKYRSNYKRVWHRRTISRPVID
ncbi:MAG: hypothetical protein AAFN77_22430 [Planctomycetota bacterium]